MRAATAWSLRIRVLGGNAKNSAPRSHLSRVHAPPHSLRGADRSPQAATDRGPEHRRRDHPAQVRIRSGVRAKDRHHSPDQTDRPEHRRSRDRALLRAVSLDLDGLDLPPLELPGELVRADRVSISQPEDAGRVSTRGESLECSELTLDAYQIAVMDLLTRREDRTGRRRGWRRRGHAFVPLSAG